MIQDIFPHKFDNHFKPGLTAEPDDILLCFSGERVLCRAEEGNVAFPHFGECEKTDGTVYLFEIDGQRFFLDTGRRLQAEGFFKYEEIRSLRRLNAVQRHLVFAAVTARHLNDWYSSNRFCGRCAAALVPSQHERAMVCPECGKVFYPRINPAVIVAVTDGDNLLLTKYAHRNLPFYALVAGFTEIGESFEETVRREVMEETGLKVKNIRYYKSQPWGFSGDILAGYFCDVDGDIKIHMDTGELKEALWMPRAQVPGQMDDFSLTNEMMLAFRDGTEGKP